MAQWSVVTDRPTVPVWLIADSVIERSELAGDQVRWVVELPMGAEPILRMLRGVVSVRPALRRIDRNRGRSSKSTHLSTGSLQAWPGRVDPPEVRLRSTAPDG